MQTNRHSVMTQFGHHLPKPWALYATSRNLPLQARVFLLHTNYVPPGAEAPLPPSFPAWTLASRFFPNCTVGKENQKRVNLQGVGCAASAFLLSRYYSTSTPLTICRGARATANRTVSPRSGSGAHRFRRATATKFPQCQELPGEPRDVPAAPHGTPRSSAQTAKAARAPLERTPCSPARIPRVPFGAAQRARARSGLPSSAAPPPRSTTRSLTQAQSFLHLGATRSRPSRGRPRQLLARGALPVRRHPVPHRPICSRRRLRTAPSRRAAPAVKSTASGSHAP